ncbi:MAG TPA: cyclase family protein [bacterium]|nr:cyclase family protein [bacterium]
MSGLAHDHSRWGPGDQLGAGNLLTPERRLAALGLVREGRLYDLSQTIETGAPRMRPVQTPYVITHGTTWRDGIRRRRALGATNDAGSNLERVEMTMHVGTHIDALGHFSIGERLYNGFAAAESMTDQGLVNLGIEHAPPIITRGLCLDVSGLDGGAFLEAGRAVGAADIEQAMQHTSLTAAPGDVVFVHTGWGRFFMADNDRYTAGEPGIDEAAARLLTSWDVVAIGADNMAVEALPGTEHPTKLMPVHQHALAEAGVYLIENLVLDALVRDGVTAFCLLLLPVKFKGATGCPVRPVALV